MNLARTFRALRKISFNTLYINFKYLPFRQAIQLPIWISRRCKLMETKGRLVLSSDIKTGMIRIGYGQIGVVDNRHARCVWELRGTLEFKGTATLGPGCKINVGDKARLVLGDQLSITANTAIACHHSIQIGANCLFSWDSQVMDTDFHGIYNDSGKRLNPDAPIVIEDGVWVGSRSSILKGSHIPKGCVLAANSVTNKKFDKDHCLIGGVPAKVLKEDIHWKA